MYYHTPFLQACYNLCGGPFFYLEGEDEYENIKYWQTDQEGFIKTPTKEEVEAETARLTPIFTYTKKRKEAYPSIQEQLDLQYWDQVNGTTKWKEAIDKVKADNPKS